MIKNKAYKITAMSAVGVILVVAALIWFMSMDNRQPVMEINSEKISSEELLFYVNRNRTKTMSHFYSKYAAEANADFWGTEFEGATPKAYLLSEAKKDLRFHKAFLEDCKKNGLIESKEISFTALQKSFEEENTRRSEALEKSEVVYGPEQMDFDNYFDYVISNLQIRLKEILKDKKRLEADDAKLREYYKEVQSQHSFFKTKEGYIAFEKALPRLKIMMEQKLFDDYISHLAESQKVKVNEEEISKISIS